MSTSDENGNRATVAVVNAKVDGLKDLIRAEFQDVGRRLDDLSGLEPRIRSLENEAVRRVGPIIDEMRAFEVQVSTLADKVTELDRKAATVEHVKVALQFEREQQAKRSGNAFSKKEKLFGLVFAGLLAAQGIFQMLHNL